MRSDTTEADPPMVARMLCHFLATAGGSHWVSVDAVAEQTKFPQERVIAGAAYAHICGWMVYATDSLMLTETGRALASERVEHTRPLAGQSR
jgi:hypothetical protein